MFRLPFLMLLAACATTGTPAAARSAAQQSIVLRVIPVMNHHPLSLYEGTAADSLRVTTLRCYISGVSLWLNDREVWAEPHSYHLLDAGEPERMTLQLQAPEGLRYDAVRFNLGVDSATSCSGAQGGDLDPAKGMYWAWQSGYINFKLEGFSPLSGARKHAFQFHLGGYQYPFAAMQPVSLRIKPGAELDVFMNLDRFFAAVDMKQKNSVMIPGAEAADLAKLAAAMFQTQP